MAHFVKQHEQHISGDELHQSLAVLCRKTLKTRIITERDNSGVDPGFQALRFG